MAKKTSDNSKDAALLYTKNAVDRLVVTSSEPANYAAVAAATLGAIAFTSTDVTGPVVGSVAGSRKVTYAAKNDIDVTASGTANHICLVDDGGSELLEVTTISNPQAVTSGNKMNVASWERQINEAT